MRISYIVILLLIGAGVYGWYWKYTHPYIIEVTVSTVQKGDVEATVANTRAGTVKACRRAKLSPSIGGQISALPYKEGEKVKKGAVLLHVWNSDLQAEVEYKKKTVIVARNTAKASCLQADIAKRSAERARTLIRSKTISRESYDQANTEAQVRTTECEVAGDNISVAQASLKVAETQIKRTILVAPFDGSASKRQVTLLFLLEAAVLSGLGGIAGMLAGLGIAWLLHFFIPPLPVSVSWNYVILAEIIAVVTGMIAGLVPARRAAAMAPVDALRSE